LGIVVFAIVSLYFLFKSNKDKTHFSDARELAVKNIEQVDEIHLISITGDTVILKKESDFWKVNDQFIARRDRVEHLLNTIENVEVRTPVPTSQKASVLKQMNQQQVEVSIFSGGKKISSYLVGHPTADQLGTYMINTSEESFKDKVFITYLLGFNGYLTSRYDARVGFWRDNTVIHYPELKIQKVRLTLEGDTFEINFDGKNYSSNIQSDESEIRRYLLNYKKLAVEYYAEEPSKELYSPSPFFTLQIISLNDVIQRLEGYRKKAPQGMLDINGKQAKWDKNRFYLKTNNEWAVAQYFVFDPILISTETLR
jgi:hypothetical protein